MEENLCAMLAAFARARPDGKTRAWDGLAAACSAVDFSMFNTACLRAKVATAAELEERIGQAAAYFAGWKLPWSFWVCDHWVDGGLRGQVQEAFRRHGLHLALELPGMRAETLAPPERPCEGLIFRRVGDAGTRAAFTHLMCAVFGIPAGAAKEVYGSEGFWNGALAGWVAYRDESPVASAATLATGAIGVYAVGTPPAYRRRGYGQAMMRHAIERASAESGPRASVLQSSEAGFRMYRLMGYRPVARYAVFASRP